MGCLKCEIRLSPHLDKGVISSILADTARFQSLIIHQQNRLCPATHAVCIAGMHKVKWKKELYITNKPLLIYNIVYG